MGAQHDEAEVIKQRILAALSSAETLRYRGAVLATWKQARGTQRVDLAALEAAHPELVARFEYEQPLSASTYRGAALDAATNPALCTKPKMLLRTLDTVLALRLPLIVLIKASKHVIETVTYQGCGGQ